MRRLDCTDDHRRLVNYLFNPNRYDPVVRPVLDKLKTTEMEMKLFVAQVLDMDERKQTLKTNVWLTLEWIDEFMIWKPEDYNNITDIKIPTQKLWMPDLTLYDNADKYVDFLRGNNRLVVLDYGGIVHWASPVIFKTYCKIGVRLFPFDRQQCPLKFGLWQYNGNEVYVNGSGDTTVFKSDGEWEMENLLAEGHVEYYPDAPGIPYTDVTYTVLFRRRSQYYIFNLIMPCILISIISMLNFFLPADSGEKISLGITALLSLTVFLLLIAETMPPSSEVPLIGQYYAATMVLVSLSLVMTVMVLNLHYRGPSSKPVPRWVKRLVLGHLQTFLLVRNPPNFNENFRKSRRKMRRRDFTISEFVPYTEDGRESPINGIKFGGRLKRPNENMNSANHSEPQATEHSALMKHIVREMKSITARLDDQDKHSILHSEWKQVALVIDRLFLIIYFIGTSLTIVYISINIPMG
uniref:Neuronal acetylcholine receptor subunit alpha-9-like n=1 Tax=Saccoglossus kowalevskii TaxID=10224 RepID=A0ABM0LWX7_SACKO|nr:PREDICTED: neuronal acetylcholine receptor subunit alpha-9-like [Saccoglossus kowalevskii]